jgi:hypothetical protein
MKQPPPSEHPHGSSDKDCDALFTKEMPEIRNWKRGSPQ